MTDTPWWRHRLLLMALVVAAAIPLLSPPVPPLTDLLGHVGRWGVQTQIETSPFLRRWFSFDWALIGNLGLDLLIGPLTALVGLEPAAKLLVIAIQMLATAGLIWTAGEAHGRMPASAFFALPLVWGYPFQFGFVNFSFAMALALNAFALWLRMGRFGRFRLRAVLFVPVGGLVWLCHSFGWAVLSILVYAAEAGRWRTAGKGWIESAVRGGVSALPLAPPALLMLLWRSGGVAGQTADFLNWRAKYWSLMSVLRDENRVWDLASVAIVGTVIAAGVARLRASLEPRLALAALLMLAAFLALPRILLGSAYADMRLAPYLVAVAVLAVRPLARPRVQALVAMLGLAFFAARLTGHMLHYLRLDRAYQAQLAALDHVPVGSRLLVLVQLPCSWTWSHSRMDHLGSLAIGRRQAFVNGQWAMPGAQLLRIRYPAGGRFVGDPTQLLRPIPCHRTGEPFLVDTVQNFPRAAFDYLWLIDRPPAGWLHRPDLVPVWHGRTGILYRVASATSAIETPNGSERRATQ